MPGTWNAFIERIARVSICVEVSGWEERGKWEIQRSKSKI
jgi:hypothetical protein